ncbi:hypothetical protein HYPSUDRAFT_629951 [Hypholoma sublateritium FD-334 SS-4]|uniref:Uncharacterized protein n=1 Tax=Hypholoma sublateritium (strain FD-334 SS-4) TaxID=945553 RepID=A0A0D2PDL8_HYPSF|nr:hypothetical protein HYPSUDRAFT_629951 [Hypholoma sublateritium FD-334 SS-4]
MDGVADHLTCPLLVHGLSNAMSDRTTRSIKILDHWRKPAIDLIVSVECPPQAPMGLWNVFPIIHNRQPALHATFLLPPSCSVRISTPLFELERTTDHWQSYPTSGILHPKTVYIIITVTATYYSLPHPAVTFVYYNRYSHYPLPNLCACRARARAAPVASPDPCRYRRSR